MSGRWIVYMSWEQVPAGDAGEDHVHWFADSAVFHNLEDADRFVRQRRATTGWLPVGFRDVQVDDPVFVKLKA